MVDIDNLLIRLRSHDSDLYGIELNAREVRLCIEALEVWNRILKLMSGLIRYNN